MEQEKHLRSIHLYITLVQAAGNIKPSVYNRIIHFHFNKSRETFGISAAILKAFPHCCKKMLPIPSSTKGSASGSSSSSRISPILDFILLQIANLTTILCHDPISVH